MEVLIASKPDVAAFVRRGILPDDVPPIFTTKDLVAPSDVDDANYHVTRDVVGRPSPYNGSKRGFQRRAYGVPHPVFVRDAALFFRKHWSAIRSHIDHPSLSASIPIFEETRSRALKITPHAKLPALRLKQLAEFRYCLVTDVSRCFPSIYTHSIPWALNGKAKAKLDRNPNSSLVFGNRLDYIFRQAQDGQTMGIPVGPDHSRVTAEIVLASVDRLYRKSVPQGCYLRHVDDVWIGRDSAAECEESLHALRKALNEFSLDINELKTRIVRTSLVVSENWPYDLEAQLEHALSLDSSIYQGRIVSLLGSIIEKASSDRDDGVIKFFLRRLDSWEKWDEHWEILEPFLAHCAIQFPHSIDYVAQIVAWRIRTMRDYNEEIWESVADKVIYAAASTGRDSEAAWSLWLAKELGVSISRKLYENLLSNVNPLALALLVSFNANGMVRRGPTMHSIWDKVGANPLADESWPLALQLRHERVRKPRGVSLDGPDQLKAIFDARCTLIDWAALPSAFVGEDEAPENNPISALRFTGSNYEGDEDEEDDDDMPF